MYVKTVVNNFEIIDKDVLAVTTQYLNQKIKYNILGFHIKYI